MRYVLSVKHLKCEAAAVGCNSTRLYHSVKRVDKEQRQRYNQAHLYCFL